jgi:hypothetical protein
MHWSQNAQSHAKSTELVTIESGKGCKLIPLRLTHSVSAAFILNHTNEMIVPKRVKAIRSA